MLSPRERVMDLDRIRRGEIPWDAEGYLAALQWRCELRRTPRRLGEGPGHGTTAGRRAPRLRPPPLIDNHPGSKESVAAVAIQPLSNIQE